jgi:hypothetical protein
MQSQDEMKKIIDEHYFTDSIREWYQKYQDLDELSVKLDNMVGEINHLRGLVEQKMKDLDRFFTPPCE